MAQDFTSPPITNAQEALSVSQPKLNDCLEALRTLHSGATTPTTTVAYMLWADTTNDVLKIRNAADTGWIGLFGLWGVGVRPGFTIPETGDFTPVDGESDYTVDTTSGDVTVNLPAAASSRGRSWTFKKIAAANSIILDANGSETIDGSTTQTITALYDSVTVWCDGTEWWIR